MRLFVSSLVLVCVPVISTTGTDQDDPIARTAEPPALTIQVRPASLTIAGTVSSDGHKAILSRTAAGHFPDKTVDLDVEVKPALPPRWALISDLTLQALATTRSAEAEVTTDRIGVSGVTSDEAAWTRAALAIERNLPDGMTFEHHVEEIGSPASLERQCVALFRTAIRGRKIEFARSSAELGTAGYAVLDELIQIAVDCPAASIRITGHTDNTGDESVNAALSRARADAVADYLVAGGINGSRIEVRGAGSSEPLVSGADARARQLNRRIEIDLQFP